ncbi:hypothetical protein OAT67_03795 [Bacteriovoracaceae bacterium]|nr:hypothetical protein [Bacteriovoracaceae bacterium]
MILEEIIGLILAAGIIILPFLFLGKKLDTRVKRTVGKIDKNPISDTTILTLMMIIIVLVNHSIFKKVGLAFSVYELIIVVLAVLVAKGIKEKR